MSARPSVQDPEQLTRAHVVPFAVFVGFLILLQLVGGFIEWKHPDAPWWRQDPAQIVYPLQTLVTLGVLICYWRCYTFNWSLKWGLVGVLFGAVGIGFWLLPTYLYDSWGLVGKTEGWFSFFGVDERKEGFDPGLFQNPLAYWGSLLMRFLRAAVVVALVEEIFWRGFLMRFISVRRPVSSTSETVFWRKLLARIIGDWEGDCWKQPFGKHGWLSYFVVTGMFIMAHGASDRPVAFIYGSLTYLLCVWSRNLGACVIMHATANFLMGVYIMRTGNYGLW